jgi:hypothetical protein
MENRIWGDGNGICWCDADGSRLCHVLVQIYMDDIIFGGSYHVLVSSFQEMMEKEFQMSMTGELNFFLGIQVKQTKQGTFVHQAKYTKDLMKKFNIAKLKPVSTPMIIATTLDPDENGDAVDQREYRNIIGSLLYVMATQLDISFAVCVLLGFSVLFTSDSSSVNLHVSEIHTQICDLVFHFFFA